MDEFVVLVLEVLDVVEDCVLVVELVEVLVELEVVVAPGTVEEVVL